MSLKPEEDGEGFGFGAFGTVEPFGSIGISAPAIAPPVTIFPGDIKLPRPRKGGAILGGNFDGRENISYITIDTGIIKLGRTANIDTSTNYMVSRRILNFG